MAMPEPGAGARGSWRVLAWVTAILNVVLAIDITVRLDSEPETHALGLLPLVESIHEKPELILRRWARHWAVLRAART
jgi:hypothetical protein